MKVPRLHPDTIEEVRQRVDIVDVISEYVVLQKRGTEFKGLCPFHNEKTPSFSVNREKQQYYCFGCQAGGNTYTFLMEIGKQSFAEVVLDLARRYQVEVKTVEPEQRKEIERQISIREELYRILAVAASFYQYALYQSQGEKALVYLKEARSLEETTIKKFQLGYAPGGWETLYKYLVETKRYPVGYVEQAGLIKPRKNSSGYYDVFRDRLIIPIMDLRGKVIGFGSRSLRDEDLPKYLNSPETPLFDKSKTLFALDKAHSSITRADSAVVVEGYFDAIALHEAGIDNAVASLGTAFTKNQLNQLLRFTASKKVILNFDADNAGNKATERAIAEVEDLVYSGVVQLRILNLPGGKDADEFIRNNQEGAVKYFEALENAPLWLDWLINRLLANRELKAADDFQRVAGGMVKLLNRLQDANQRNHYLTHCAELLSQGDARLLLQNLATLKSQTKDFRPKYKNNSSQKQPKAIATPRLTIVNSPEKELLEQAEALLLRIYIHHPRYRENIIDRLEEKDLLFTLPPHRFLWLKILEIEAELTARTFGDTNPLLRELHNRSLDFPEDKKEVIKMFNLDEKTQEDLFRADIRVEEAIASLEQVNYQKREIYYTKQLENLNPATDLKLMKYYLEEIQTAKRAIEKLQQKRLGSSEFDMV